jgi:ribonuclease Z
MKRWFNRKTGLVLGLIILAIVVAGALFFKPLMNTWMNSIVRSALSKKNVQYEDGIYAGLCGTGSPMSDINRVGPCISVLAGGHAFIVDAGEGSTPQCALDEFPDRKDRSNFANPLPL